MLNKIFSVIKRYSFYSLLVVYGILVAIFYFSEKLGGENPLISNDFILSFRASLLEDIIFFSFVGVVVYISSFRSSEDEKVDTRIASIINADITSVSSKEYFREKIGEILTYYDDLKVTITLSEYKRNEGSIKIEAHFEGDILNMTKDLPLKTVIKAYANPGLVINNQAGEVKFLEIRDNNASSKKIFDYSKSSKPIKPKNGFSLKEPVEISPNGKVGYQYSFWIWSVLQDTNDLAPEKGFTFSADRFVNTLVINVINDTGQNINTKIWREAEGSLGEKEYKEIYNDEDTDVGNQSIDSHTASLKHGEAVSLGLSLQAGEKNENKSKE